MKLFLVLCSLLAIPAHGSVAVTEHTMQMLYESSALSMLTYEGTTWDYKDETGEKKAWARAPSEYDTYEFARVEPDAAIVAKIGGFCYIAFRGTDYINYWEDNWTNIDPISKSVCNKRHVCCKGRGGYVRAFRHSITMMTPGGKTVEEELRNCASSCSNKDECVVFTGHSQGGAIATIAAVHFADLNPYTVTFGQPNSVKEGCGAITSERFFRVVNTVALKSTEYPSQPVSDWRHSTKGGVILSYDTAAFFMASYAGEYGHLLITSGGDPNFAYFGIDEKLVGRDLRRDVNDATKWYAHDKDLYITRMKDLIDSGDDLYIDRMKDLLNSGHFPVPVDGFQDDTPCTNSIECDGACHNGKCTAAPTDKSKLLPSCEKCTIDYQCRSDKCITYSQDTKYCSNDNKLMDDGCFCKSSDVCQSGRCELETWNPFGDLVCVAKLAEGSFCNEDSDCISGYCSSWWGCASSSSSSLGISEKLRGRK